MKSEATHRFLATLQGIFVGMYGMVNRSGLFRLGSVRRIFQMSYFAYKKHLEDPFWRLSLMRPELFREGAALDIGANIGYNSYVFARIIDPGYQVFAFEPDPRNFSQLQEVVRRYGLRGKVVPVCSAVGNSEGEVEFWHNREHPANHRIFTPTLRQTVDNRRNVFRVPICSIDRFFESHDRPTTIRFIKIDVQGFELPVCEGMIRILERNPRAIVVIEYEPAALSTLGFPAKALLDFLTTRFAYLYVLSQQGELTRTDPKQIDVMARDRVSLDLLCSRDDLDKSAN